MVTYQNGWNPLAPASWADALGLVSIPAFGGGKHQPPGEHTVMLDGERASFLMSVTDDKELPLGRFSRSRSASDRDSEVRLRSQDQRVLAV